MKNKSEDLRNHLFVALERLNDEDLTEEKLLLETKRAKAISDVGKVIIENIRTELQCAKTIADYGFEIEFVKNNKLLNKKDE